MLTLAPDARRTFRLEQVRAVFGGVLETAGSTFLLLIAVRFYSLGSFEKSLLSIGAGTGLLLSPLAVWAMRTLELPPSRAAAMAYGLAGLILLFPALIPSPTVFIIACPLGVVLMASTIPLLTQMFQDNYPDERRGSLFAAAVVSRIVASGAFSLLGGWLLDSFAGATALLLFGFALSALGSALCLWLVPLRSPTEAESGMRLSGRPAFHLLVEDRMFRWTLISWMLMGFANLFMVPLRVEVLANPAYGVSLEPLQVALVTGVVPNISRLVMSRVWGALFDRVNFFLLRIALNIGFMAGILTFFTGFGWTGLVTGAVLFGVAMAGGDIAWSLWVTKIAPPERVADYMAVHTFFTGVRGIIAPFLAFQLIQTTAPSLLAIGCAALMIISCLLLVPEVKSIKRRRRAIPLLPEDPD